MQSTQPGNSRAVYFHILRKKTSGKQVFGEHCSSLQHPGKSCIENNKWPKKHKAHSKRLSIEQKTIDCKYQIVIVFPQHTHCEHTTDYM